VKEKPLFSNERALIKSEIMRSGMRSAILTGPCKGRNIQAVRNISEVPVSRRNTAGGTQQFPNGFSANTIV